MLRQLPLEERFATFQRNNATVTALTGASTAASIYSPAAGLRAKVQWVWAFVRFPSAPGAADIGLVSLRVIRAATTFRLGGTRVVFADGQREQTIGFPCSLIISEDDDIQVLANAISSAISVDAEGTVHALEYPAF